MGMFGMFRGSAASSAAGSATPAFSDPVDLVNSPAGDPAQERWPGALDPAVHTDPGAYPPGGPAGPVYGVDGAEPFGSSLPPQVPGGGWQDTTWVTGHDAPAEAWDSSAGAPFAPSGALSADLHAQDTGGVYRQEHVTPAEIGTLTRRTTTGETHNRVANTMETIGQTTPAGRVNLDQYQVHDPDGYHPWTIPYAERPILNNLAYEAMPITPTGSAYTPSGVLPNRAPLDYAAVAYEAPPDPAVATTVPSGGGMGGGWVL